MSARFYLLALLHLKWQIGGVIGLVALVMVRHLDTVLDFSPTGTPINSV